MNELVAFIADSMTTESIINKIKEQILNYESVGYQSAKPTLDATIFLYTTKLHIETAGGLSEYIKEMNYAKEATVIMNRSKTS